MVPTESELQRQFSRLPAHESRLLTLRLVRHYSLRQAAAVMNISLERARRAELDALRTLAAANRSAT